MAAAKIRHQCERCGLEAVLERAGRFNDEDYRELLQEYFALEQQFAATLHFKDMHLGRAQEQIRELQRIICELLPEPVREGEFVDEEERRPF